MQSAHFGQKLFSIFTACRYLKIDSVILNENVTVTSKANDHSRSAAMSSLRKVLPYVREKHRPEGSLTLHFWSDGFSGQFYFLQLQFLFFLSLFELDHTIFWNYKERHYRKGSIDGVGGTIKHRVFHDVKSGKVSITNAKHFVAHADAILNGIKSFYMPNDEVLEMLEDNEKLSPRTDGTLEVHKIACSFSTVVCKLEFFKTAVDKQPFHFMCNTTRRIGIQMFAVTLSFPCAMILIKHVLSAIVFMPKIGSGWSAI